MIPPTARKLNRSAQPRQSSSLLVVGTVISLISASLGYWAHGPQANGSSVNGASVSGSSGGVTAPSSGAGTGPAAGGGNGGTGTTGAAGTGISAVGPASGKPAQRPAGIPTPESTKPRTTDPCAGKLSCGALKATDTGVDASTIRLGYLIPNTSSIASAGASGGLSADQANVVTAWTNEMNRLGVNGRKVQVVSQTFDVTDPQNMQAACKTITQDQKVFSVVTPGGYDGIAQLCIAKENRTPFIGTDPEPADWYRQANGYLYSTFMSKDRIMLNNVDWLLKSGYLRKGDKVGLIYHDQPTVAPAVEKTYLPALRARGINAVTVKLATDLATGLSQIPGAVNQFKRQGVTFVLPVMNLIYKGAFQNAAQTQAWHPRYDESDIYFGCSEFTTTSYNMSQFDGTRCLTTTDNRQYTSAARHPTAWTTYADAVYKRSFPGGYYTGGKSDADAAAQAVLNYSTGTLFMLWYQAAERAGTQLTRALWAQSMQMTGPVTNQIGYCSLSFGRGKFDGADDMSVSEFRAEASDGYAAKSFHTVNPCAKVGH